MTDRVLSIDGEHSFILIKPLIGFKADIEKRLRQFPYDNNVFLMMRFRDSNSELSDFMIESLEAEGLRGVRADHPDWNITNDVYNPIAVLYCCKYGIALFDEPEAGQTFNPNVVYELAMMHYQGKQCLILRHADLPQVPFDLIKDLHMPYKSDLAVRTNIRKWVQQLGLSKAVRPKQRREPAESDLQKAVITTKSPDAATIVPSEDPVEAVDFRWKVKRKYKRSQRIAWEVRILNSGTTQARPRIELMCLDESGFALYALDEKTDRELQPNGETVHRSEFSIAADLAERLAGIMLTVSID